MIFYQIWRFVAPGLYRHEKRLLIPFTVISSCCFIGGGLFAYFVVFPPAFKFLIGYGNAYLAPMPAVKDYFTFCLRLLLAFGIIFELPIFIVFLARMGMVDGPFLRKNRKYAFLIAFIIAAILTPTPDVINQVLMGGPLVVLYEISILAVYLFGRKKFSGYDPETDHGDRGDEKPPSEESQ